MSRDRDGHIPLLPAISLSKSFSNGVLRPEEQDITEDTLAAKRNSISKAHEPIITIHRKPVSTSFQKDDGCLLSKNNSVKILDLPPYDYATGTRNVCIAGLVFSWVISIVCIALAPWIFRTGRIFLDQEGGYALDEQGQRTFFLGSVGQELVKLAVNICIAICTDCLGYIHATSLRWALRREGRLFSNSNLRLLASTRCCSSSRWSMNFVSAFLLMTCYASSGQLFLSADVAREKNFTLNGVAVAALGVGILGQAAVSSLCFINSSKFIPTWSSNPLNTTLVLLHQGLLQRCPARCMLSVHSASLPSGPSLPIPRQSSLRQAKAASRNIIRVLWSLFALTLIWGHIVLVISRTLPSQHHSSNISFYGANVPTLEFNISALLITIAFQACLTLGLHATELLVNISRDESMWRRASKPSGVQYSYGGLGSVQAALYSWQTMCIFTLKPVAHWLFGLSVNTKGGLIFFNWVGILSLSAAVLVLALFGTFLARRKPKGPQPATFGHLQSLADLVDVWGAEGQSIWWGDKGPSASSEIGAKGVRHAGTDTKRLEPVCVDSLYAGS